MSGGQIWISPCLSGGFIVGCDQSTHLFAPVDGIESNTQTVKYMERGMPAKWATSHVHLYLPFDFSPIFTLQNWKAA